MLPASHNRAYQDFLCLLIELKDLLAARPPQTEKSELQGQLSNLTRWYEQNLVNLDSDNIDGKIAPRWQAVQTEIKREFKLLSTDILFFSSARQNATKSKRLESISDRLDKLIGYCQIMLKNND